MTVQGGVSTPAGCRASGNRAETLLRPIRLPPAEARGFTDGNSIG